MNKKDKIRIVVNIAIAIMVFGAWLDMLFFAEGTLAEVGVRSLKYFTIQSNLLAGIAAIIWLARCRKGVSKAVESFKYVAAASVALTFITVMTFLGPMYGYPEMLVGANLWLHLVVPVVAIAEVIFLSDVEYTRKDNNLVLIPLAIYGTGYLANNIINGIGEGAGTNDWYLFLTWGYPVGFVIFAVLFLVTWLMAFGMRIARQRIAGSRRNR